MPKRKGNDMGPESLVTSSGNKEGDKLAKGPSKPLVNDYTVTQCVLDAKRDGLPAATLKKWCTDLNRDFYVQEESFSCVQLCVDKRCCKRYFSMMDDASFIKAWGELRDKWEKNNSRKKRKQQQREERGARQDLPTVQPVRSRIGNIGEKIAEVIFSRFALAGMYDMGIDETR